MLSASKKIKFLSIVLGSLLAASTSVFGQTVYSFDDLDNSAKKRATAGQFSSDSDKIKSSDIFDLQRSFFSAGYLGDMTSVNGNGTGDAAGMKSSVQGAFGVALPNNMYLGFTGKYYFNDKDGTVYGDKAQRPISGYDINSSLAMRLAFRINDMASVHYGLNFGPKNGSLYNVKKTVNEASKDNYTEYQNHGFWNHEIAASVKFGEHKFTLPVAVIFHADNYKIKGIQNDKKIDTVTYQGEDYISLRLNPEANLGIVSGPLTGITVGATLEFGLNNNYGVNGTSEAADMKAEGKEGKDRFDGDIYASFPMEWSLSGDKVKLAMEPKVSLGVSVRNTGNDIQKYTAGGQSQSIGTVKYNSLVTFKPYAELPIGTTWRPVEWYELRLGTAMVVSADYTWDTTTPATADGKKLDESKKYTSYSFETYAGAAAFFGMGFIVGEDFDLDLYAEATKLKITDISFGGQLTYRF